MYIILWHIIFWEYSYSFPSVSRRTWLRYRFLFSSSCCVSAAWSPESLSSDELLEDPTMTSTLLLSGADLGEGPDGPLLPPPPPPPPLCWNICKRFVRKWLKAALKSRYSGPPPPPPFLEFGFRPPPLSEISGSAPDCHRQTLDLSQRLAECLSIFPAQLKSKSYCQYEPS